MIDGDTAFASFGWLLYEKRFDALPAGPLPRPPQLAALRGESLIG